MIRFRGEDAPKISLDAPRNDVNEFSVSLMQTNISACHNKNSFSGPIDGQSQDGAAKSFTPHSSTIIVY